MRIHQITASETATSLAPAKNTTPERSRLGVMQERTAFTPLAQKEGHADFSLRGVLNKLPFTSFPILPPSSSHFSFSGKETDMDTFLGKKPRMYESNLEVACRKNAGQSILMEQEDYIKTVKKQLPAMKDKAKDVETGVCLGLSTLWLLGRHSGLDDHAVLENLLGYDTDKDEIISDARAEAGFDKVYVVQNIFQYSARSEGRNDKRFRDVTPVIQRYDMMQRVSGLAKMSIEPVAGEVPFVLLSRKEEMGNGLIKDVLRDGREQLLMVHSDGHAMAIYSNGHDQYAFYDPNNGMFNFHTKNDLAAFMNRTGRILFLESPMLGSGNPDMLMVMEMKVH